MCVSLQQPITAIRYPTPSTHKLRNRRQKVQAGCKSHQRRLSIPVERGWQRAFARQQQALPWRRGSNILPLFPAVFPWQPPSRTASHRRSGHCAWRVACGCSWCAAREGDIQAACLGVNTPSLVLHTALPAPHARHHPQSCASTARSWVVGVNASCRCPNDVASRNSTAPCVEARQGDRRCLHVSSGL